MPAAAVTPAPIVYIKVVAVKKLVVGFLTQAARSAPKGVCYWMLPRHPSRKRVLPITGSGLGISFIYFEKIRVFKAGICCEYISME